MKKIYAIAASLMLLSPFVAQAQTPSTPVLDQRQANQEQRIQQGVQSGSLTQRETARLDRGQDRVQRIEDKANADGTVTRKERIRMQHAQDVESKRIYRQKHDRQHDFNHDGKKDRLARRR